MTTRNTYRIGRDADGNAVFVTLALTERTGSFTTTAHEPAERVTRLSVIGGVRDGARRDYSTSGQIIDDVAAVRDFAPGWTAQDVASLVAIWRRWHLNDTRAGCVHVPEPLMEDTPYRRVDLVNTPACPVTGHRYGHAWLMEEPPADVLAEFRRLMALPSGNVPTWAL